MCEALRASGFRKLDGARQLGDGLQQGKGYFCNVRVFAMIPLSLSSMSCLNHGPNSTPAVLDGYSYHEGMTCNVGNDFDIKYSQASIFETEDASQCITKCKDLGSLCNAFTHVRSSPQVAGKCYLWSSWVDVSKYTDDSRDCYVKAG